MDNPNPNPNPHPSPKLTPIPEQDPQLLWISRATSKSRYMVDEASRFEMLGVSLGVPITVLDVESYSLRKVAMLVQGVSVLAGAHGAGLAWLVFLRNPAAVTRTRTRTLALNLALTRTLALTLTLTLTLSLTLTRWWSSSAATGRRTTGTTTTWR